MNESRTETDASSPAQSSAREFTPAERTALQQAQQHLFQRRVNAKALNESRSHQFGSGQQPTLMSGGSPAGPGQHFVAPPRPTPPETAGLTAATATQRHQQEWPSLPAVWAAQALEQAQPILNQQVRRRDARKNARVVLQELLQVSAPASSSGPTSLADFLAMIPENSGTAANQAPLLVQGASGEWAVNQQDSGLQNGDNTCHQQPPLPQIAGICRKSALCIPVIRLKSRTITERVSRIVQDAEDSGRLHSARATRLYELLVTATLAHHVALRPDLRVTPSRLTVFLVVDELSVLLGFSRATVYRAFKDLDAGGLVDKRPWYTDSTVRLRQKTRKNQPENPLSEEENKSVERKKEDASVSFTAAAGVLVDVVLTPSQATKARVMANDLRHGKYRNLDADRSVGRTAWQWITETQAAKQRIDHLEAQMKSLPLDRAHTKEINTLQKQVDEVRQSTFLSGKDAEINHLLRWTLSSPDQKPVTLTVSAQQEAVYRLSDLLRATPQQRGELINERAQALCLATGDGQHNIGFWRWSLWRMVELEYTQPGTIGTLSVALLRLMVDLDEWGSVTTTLRPLKNPGALFVSRLQKSGWWEELKVSKTA